MAPSPSRSRTPLVIGIVLAVVAVAAIVAVVAAGGGDDEETDECAAVSITSTETVTVEGDGLPQGEPADDPCIGQPVPTLVGADYAGNATTIDPGEDGPMMIVVMAHWCPHCNDEVPKLVEWGASGDVPDGLQVVGISTAAREGTPNFPPASWVADDEEQTAARAVGTTGYPFIMFVDADGNLLFRVSAELPIVDVQALADQAAATATT